MSQQTSVNIAFTSTGSFVPGAVQRKMTMIDNTNRNFPRYAYMTQDTFGLVFATSSVVIPLSQIYAAAVSGSPFLSWPPVILTQPTSSTVTHPTASYFVVSASAELPISYAWFYSSGSVSWTPVSGSNYTGSLTNALTSSTTNVATQNTASYMCVLTNAAGTTSSSVAILNVL